MSDGRELRPGLVRGNHLEWSAVPSELRFHPEHSLPRRLVESVSETVHEKSRRAVREPQQINRLATGMRLAVTRTMQRIGRGDGLPQAIGRRSLIVGAVQLLLSADLYESRASAVSIHESLEACNRSFNQR
jgi:hypothetical protein